MICNECIYTTIIRKHARACTHTQLRVAFPKTKPVKHINHVQKYDFQMYPYHSILITSEYVSSLIK